MRFNIKGTNLKLTKAIKDYTQAKVDKLEKFLGIIKIINADVELELTTKHHNKGEIFRAEINLELPQELLRIEKTEKDLYKAIDKAEGHMAMLLKKYKDKRVERRRRGAKEE